MDVCQECQHNCSSNCKCWCHGRQSEEINTRCLPEPNEDDIIVDELRSMLSRTRELAYDFLGQKRYAAALEARSTHEALKETIAAIRND